MNILDTAKAVRTGEELDLDTVETYLKDTIPGLSGDLVIEQFPSGFSNLTYLIRVGETELVLRRPPIGANIKTAHDMGREYRVLTALKPVFAYGPTPLAYCEDTAVMGCPFYVMERLKGIILRKDLPSGMHLSADQARQLCENLLDVHVQLHEIDVAQAGLSFIGKPEGYVSRQVNGWTERYRKAITDDAPAFEEVITWLAEKMPADTNRPVMVHNDYKFDNVVLDPQNPINIIGVLDWEMATYGDPLMDLGNSLAYWINRDDPAEAQRIRQLPTTIDGAMTREELVARYAEKTGRDVSGFDYYFCFGIFRLAGIAQQIYHRYYHGITKDERFGMLIGAVKVLHQIARTVIERSKL
ncbi:MAG: phosphotransferase family protein [Deltaproteobacteria bacterium]|nr:MAG: phosphotransferase family protein [Deltaproteobacteria bacterium]